jgi:DNA-3-methyladenine glycosylase
MKLSLDFYRQLDTLEIAHALLGKYVVTNFDGITTAAKIVETEAYLGTTDRACHAYGGRRTARTEIMYAPGGVAYVYLCYGVHHLFNVITHQAGEPHAVLIRGVEPVEGIETMRLRRSASKVEPRLCAGPGALSQALGIQMVHTGLDLTGETIYLEDRGEAYAKSEVIRSPRVGVGYAKEDALLPYRFRVIGNPWTSPAK